jgi:preprotein translocase subunit SecG
LDGYRFMQHVVIVIHLMLVLALIGVVLLQRSEGGGLGIGGGGGFMTNRGAGNVLTRTTAVLAGLFFLTSLLLSILAGLNRKPASILQGGQSTPAAPAPATAPPVSGGGLLKQLQQGAPGSQPPAPGAPAAPAAPSAPAGPQVPQSK